MKIVVAGGSGLVGTALVPHLVENGHEVTILTTGNAKVIHGCKALRWNPEVGELQLESLKDTQAIINLAGANVGQKWTKKYKETIVKSRTSTTTMLADACREIDTIRCFVNASATGIYKESEEQIFENSPEDDSFLAEVVRQWEAHCPPADDHLAVAKLRIGLVLSSDGGLYKKMSNSYSFGLGSPLGNGKQWMSWIHVDDLVKMILHLIEHRLSGVFNSVSPEPITNRDFSRAFAKSLNRPHFMPAIPFFALKLIFGEFSRELVKSYRVSCQKITDTGFKFEHTQLSEVLDVLKRQ